MTYFDAVWRQNGTTNLITRALAAVGKRLETVPDPTSVFYHLPASEAHPQVRVHCCTHSIAGISG